MALSGVAIGIFKTGALALIGDISQSTAEHTSIMNTVEGFFGVGSILGPALLSQLLKRNVSWQWLYVIAGSMCVLLIAHCALCSVPSPCLGGDELRFEGRSGVL
jgi:FHS family L-fucose permease-like MFS transporter